MLTAHTCYATLSATQIHNDVEIHLRREGVNAVAPLQKPGQIPAKPGEYVERGPRGGQIPKPCIVTIEPGDKPLPPTQKPGHTCEREGPLKPYALMLVGSVKMRGNALTSFSYLGRAVPLSSLTYIG